MFTAHIPNGSGNGWRKIDTFHALAAELRRAKDSPRILTGDFNEPKRFEDSGQIVTFGGESLDGRMPWGVTSSATSARASSGSRACGRSSTRRCQNTAYGTPIVNLHRLLVAAPLLRTRQGQADDVSTIPSSQDILEVLGCDYHHDWREQDELSDHSPIWAELCLRTE